jgi:acetolactate synthase-1/2/3 large subunit
MNSPDKDSSAPAPAGVELATAAQAERTGAQLLVSSLVEQGVDTLFGLPGLQLDHVFDALYDVQDSLRVVHTRHEQSTAYMAFGYAQATARMGTCLVVPGPGVFNTMGALSTAYACNSPVLCVTGQIPSAYMGMGLGFLHEVPHQMRAMASVSKWQATIESAAEVPLVVAEACRQAVSGRPRPVVVEIPPDITAQKTAAPLAVPAPAPAKSYDLGLAGQAAALLGGARNPAIFVGSGVIGAEQELLELAELLQAPVIMSEHGAGTLTARHPLAQSLQVGNDIWPDIDVALAVGTRFFHPIVEWGRDENIKLVRIDIDPEQSVSAWPPDVHIVSDARPALAELCRLVPTRNRARASRHEEFRLIKQAKEAKLADILRPQHEYTTVLRQALADDDIICFDVGQLHFYSWWGYPVYKPRTLIQPGYQGTLGYGYPTALGAQVGRPARRVVYVGGDGGFMFNAQEISTALQFGINVIAVVVNDNAYGNVKRTQADQFRNRYISCELRNPDFAKFADSFGMRNYRVDSPTALSAALGHAMARDEPSLVEVTITKPFPNPFPHMFFRKRRG